jgi:thioredoxin reductase (NADPH)
VVEALKVYGARWCGDCRRAKQFLGDQRIPFEWHDVELEPETLEIVHERNNGNNVIPTIVFPDGSSLSEPSNEDLADKLGLERTAMLHLYDLVLIGGGPTALTAGIYAARENLTTLIIDAKGLGGQAGITERLDNYPGFPDGIPGSELADRFVEQARRYGVEMVQALSVTSVGANGDQIEVGTANGDHYHARAALLATGSSYRRTGARGEDELIGGGIHFCATCDGPFYRGSARLAVLGGGNSGCEEGLFLAKFADKVTIIERTDHLAANALLQDKVRADPKLEVLYNREVREFKAKPDGSGKLASIVLENLASGECEEVDFDGCFVFIGLDPNSSIVAGEVELDAHGFVVTDASFMTSLEGLFAAGDVRAGSTKQLASAVGEGAAVAIQIRGYLERRLSLEASS